MSGILNRPAYERLFNEDIEWLLRQPRTLEREHIRDCLRWMREHKHEIEDIDAAEDKKPTPEPTGANS